MAREIPYIAAVNEAIAVEMGRDDSVLFYGQDVARPTTTRPRQGVRA